MGNLAGLQADAAVLADGSTLVPELGGQVSSALEGLSPAMGSLVVVGAVAVVYLVTRVLVLRVMAPVAEKTESAWDDRFVRRRAPHRLALVPPALLAAVAMPAVVGVPELVVVSVQRTALAVVVLAVAWAAFAEDFVCRRGGLARAGRLRDDL